MSVFQDWAALAKENKAKYPPGTRIELIQMNDPFSPVEAGTRGTVRHVDDAGQLHIEDTFQCIEKKIKKFKKLF